MSHSAIYEIVGPSDEILRRYVHGYEILTILAMTTMKSFTRYYCTSSFWDTTQSTRYKVIIIMRYYAIFMRY